MKKVVFYDTKDLSEMFNVHPETIRRWVRDGKLKPYEYLSRKTGMIFDYDSLVDFCRNNKKYARNFVGHILLDHFAANDIDIMSILKG